MLIVGFLGAATFSFVSLVLGVRLLVLWRTTRKLPELLIGSAFLLEGVITNSLNLAERLHDRLPPQLHGPIYVGLVATSCAGALCIAVGAWRIFRPGRRWAAAIVGLAAVALTAYTVDTATPHDGSYGPRNMAWWWVSVLGRAGCHSWMACEALYYYSLMRRRMRLGLADPVVADRMRLWGWAGNAIALLWLGVGVARTIGGPGGINHPVTLLFIAVMGFVASVTNWLVFLAPPAYRRRVERRAARAAASP